MIDEHLARADLGTVGPELGRGARATAYLLPELRLPDLVGPLVYKHYRAGHQPHGLRAIVRLRGNLPPAERDRLDTITAWPVRIVQDHGKFSGIVTTLIPGSFFEERRPAGGKAVRQPREVRNLFASADDAARAGSVFPGMVERFAVCRDLAGAFAFLHAHGVICGDFTGEKALFRIGETPAVRLVGCDAMRPFGNAAAARQPSAPDWKPPEGRVFSRETDLYKLGLFVLRALAPGPQASTSRDPHRVRNVLDAEGRRLLSASLAEIGHRRPQAAEWEAYFAALARDTTRAVPIPPNA